MTPPHGLSNSHARRTPDELGDLDAGETEALRLALCLSADAVLIDEKEGGICATSLGKRTIGASVGQAFLTDDTRLPELIHVEIEARLPVLPAGQTFCGMVTAEQRHFQRGWASVMPGTVVCGEASVVSLLRN